VDIEVMILDKNFYPNKKIGKMLSWESILFLTMHLWNFKMPILKSISIIEVYIKTTYLIAFIILSFRNIRIALVKWRNWLVYLRLRIRFQISNGVSQILW
jgi:hypothetical protein